MYIWLPNTRTPHLENKTTRTFCLLWNCVYLVMLHCSFPIAYWCSNSASTAWLVSYWYVQLTVQGCAYDWLAPPDEPPPLHHLALSTQPWKPANYTFYATHYTQKILDNLESDYYCSLGLNGNTTIVVTTRNGLWRKIFNGSWRLHIARNKQIVWV